MGVTTVIVQAMPSDKTANTKKTEILRLVVAVKEVGKAFNNSSGLWYPEPVIAVDPKIQMISGTITSRE